MIHAYGTWQRCARHAERGYKLHPEAWDNEKLLADVRAAVAAGVRKRKTNRLKRAFKQRLQF